MAAFLGGMRRAELSPSALRHALLRRWPDATAEQFVQAIALEEVLRVERAARVEEDRRRALAMLPTAVPSVPRPQSTHFLS